MGGNVTRGSSRVASTSPWVGQSPVGVCVSVAMISPFGMSGGVWLAAEGEPAEATQGDEQSGGTPGGDDEEVGAARHRRRRVWGL